MSKPSPDEIITEARRAFLAWCDDASDENAQGFMVRDAQALLSALDALVLEPDRAREELRRIADFAQADAAPTARSMRVIARAALAREADRG